MHPRQILDRYGIAPKQSLGQNFLYDERLLARIAAAAELSPDDAVLEIGPGLGALTRQLAQAAGRVVAVELDDRLLPVLRYELEPFANVEIVHGDILTFDPASRFDGPFVVVANVPYYITGAILRRLLEGSPRPRRMVLTVQREVAPAGSQAAAHEPAGRQRAVLWKREGGWRGEGRRLLAAAGGGFGGDSGGCG